MRKFITNNILLLSILIFASSTIYAQEWNFDSIKKVRDSIAAKTKSKSEVSTGIGVMSINTGTKPIGSIAVNRDPTYQTMSPAQLIQNVFTKTGSCATVSNVSVSIYGWNGTSWNAARGLAYFNKADSDFPIGEGLVMSTGDVRDTEGPNRSDAAMSSDSWRNGSDTDLRSLLKTGTIYNHCRIEFDFIPTSYVMEFKYIFASEEYPEYANTEFNDVFGFFVNEVGSGSKTNIALLPDGVTPVTINNINDGNWKSNSWTQQSTGSIGNSHNKNYFVRNKGGSRGIELDGHTTTLTATYNVVPCRKYHLKLVVGNVSDRLWGSAVFLQARSFDVGRDFEFYGNQILGNEYIFKGCPNNYFDVTRTINTNQVATIQVTHNSAGGAVNGTHYTDSNGNAVSKDVSFTANQTTKRVFLKATDKAVPGSYFTLRMMCPCEGSAVAIEKKIYIYDFVQSFEAVTTSSCSNGANGKITISATGTSGKYEYRLGSTGLWQTSNVFSGLSPGDYTVYVRDIGSCNTPLSKTVTLKNLTANAGADINNCNSNVFTLAASPLGANETGKWIRISGGNVTFTKDTQHDTKVTLTSGTTATLQWTVNNGNCSSLDNVIIINNALPIAPTVTTPVSYCHGAAASPLSVDPETGYTLKWYDANDVYLGTAAPTPSTTNAGSTIYKVSRVNTSTGCESPKSSITVNVKAPPTAKISAPSVVCRENTQITLTFALTGQSLWTIDYIEKDLSLSTEISKTITSTSATKTEPAQPYNTTEYVITKITDGYGCVSTKRDSVKVQFQPCGFKAPMLVWLKANDGTSGDAEKFEWKDRSQAMNIAKEAHKLAPYSNIIIQNSAINFNQAVKFDGTANQYLSGIAKNQNGGFSIKSTLFTVTDPTPASAKAFPQGIFSTNDKTTLGQGLFFNKLSGKPSYVMGGAVLDGTHSLSNPGSANINYPILLRGTYPDSITSKNSELWDNAVYIGKKTSPYNIYPDTTEHFDVGGSAISPGNVFDGKIAEIIYFGALLSDNEANKVNSYLAIKYGISLAQDYLASDGTTKVWNYENNLTFTSCLAGIGFDAGYALDQRISHNTSPGDMVTIAHNPTAFVTDQSLAASMPADKSYLIWANNTEDKSFGSMKEISGHKLIFLKRQWRAIKTGTVNNVSIQFDTTGINIPSGWGRKPALVVTPEKNFGGSLQFYQAVDGYTGLTFHNVDLSGSDFSSSGVSHFTLVLTEGVTADAGPNQSTCESNADYKFKMAANAPGADQAGKWEIVSEPGVGTTTILHPSLNTTEVQLAVTGKTVLRWVVWNTFSMDSDTSYVNITRHAVPAMPRDTTLQGVCPGAGNDSIVINNSNTNYIYKVYTTPIGGMAITSEYYGTGGKITIKAGNEITETTCYYIEIQHAITKCYGLVRWKVCIPVYANMKHPDIRIKVCPNPAYNLDLRTYLNAANIVNYTFTSPISLTGGHNIYTGYMTPGTYTLQYSVTGNCSSSSAKMYIYVLKNNQVPPVPKRAKICHKIDLARHVQLQQLLGLEVAGGVWEFDPSISPLTDYITTVDGAYLFNAQKAWLDKKGLLVDSDRHFTFDYYINGSMCIPNSIYRLTVIVTE